MDSATEQWKRSAEFREAGYWGDDTLVTLLDHWADADPDHTYLSDGTRSLNYGEFRDTAWNLAAGLAELGVRPGERVAVQLPNWHEYFLLYAACARLGAVVIPIVVVYRAAEVGFILEDSQAVGLVTCGEFRGFDHAAMSDELAENAPSLKFRAVVRGEARNGALSLEELLTAQLQRTVLPMPPSADDHHLILYSSGTESRPKGCLHTFNTSSFLPKQAVEALGMGRSDVMFMPAPVTHALGMTLGVMAPTVAGAAVHLLDVFEPTTALQRIDEYQCTGTASPAQFIRMMLDAYDPSVHDLSQLRFWLSAGAPIPASLVEEASSKFAGCRVVSAYGSSEVMMATVCRPEDPVERVASSDGRPVRGVEIRIVGAEEESVASGEEGEIRYRGPGRLLRYWNKPDLTAANTDEHGWWRTGDLGRLDEAGYLRVTGRLKDIIVRGGFNISAREVEEALIAHPRIANVAVVGLPDPRLGEQACAVIVADGSTEITLADIRDYLTHDCRIAIWKVPERIEFVPELPVTTTGKIQKFVLRQKFATS